VRRKPIDISGIRHLYPFTSHYLDINALKYHNVDEGQGNPVVMVHGNPTWSFYFRDLIKALSGHCRCIVPDHIGCGLSDKPDLANYDYRLRNRIDDLQHLLDTLIADEKITLVLHDWGGMIGMAYATRSPEKIGRVVLMNTAAFLPPVAKQIPLRLNIVRHSGFLGALAVLGFNLFARGALSMATAKGLTREVKNGLVAPYNCWKHRIATLKFVQDIPLTPKDPSYHQVKQVDDRLQSLSNVPMLICWGAKDFVFDQDYLAEWQRRFTKAEVHLFQEAGHYVLEDVPQKIISLVQNFIEKHPL
jgi:haloalkane dehalogenase